MSGKSKIAELFSVYGVYVPLRIEGVAIAEVLESRLAPMPVPCVRPDNLVLLDNVKFHYASRTIDLSEAARARVVSLPTHALGLNPLEDGIAKFKAALRSFKSRTKRALANALAKTLALITQNDIHKWFAHFGNVPKSVSDTPS